MSKKILPLYCIFIIFFLIGVNPVYAFSPGYPEIIEIQITAIKIFIYASATLLVGLIGGSLKFKLVKKLPKYLIYFIFLNFICFSTIYLLPKIAYFVLGPNHRVFRTTHGIYTPHGGLIMKDDFFNPFKESR